MWKVWSQLLLRMNQYNGASDIKMKNFVNLTKMLQLAPTIMVSTVQSLHRPLSGC
jgi:hypothetical protein